MSAASAHVAAFRIYPVKSCRGIPLDRARIGPRGLEWDRNWMAVDVRGQFLSQRTHPKLARVQPRFEERALALGTEDLPTLRVPLEPQGAPREVVVWRDRCAALDQGEEAARWFSALLGIDARLVRIAPDAVREADRTYAGEHAAPVAFNDAYPLLVVNAASHADLNMRMPAPVPLERFRPNLVVEGWQPWEEDEIDTLRIGAMTLRLVKPCTRCVITATDQATGERSTDPLPVLRQFRFDRRLRGVTFGENAIILEGEGSEIARGASVTADRAPRENRKST